MKFCSIAVTWHILLPAVAAIALTAISTAAGLGSTVAASAAIGSLASICSLGTVVGLAAVPTLGTVAGLGAIRSLGSISGLSAVTSSLVGSRVGALGHRGPGLGLQFLCNLSDRLAGRSLLSSIGEVPNDIEPVFVKMIDPVCKIGVLLMLLND